MKKILSFLCIIMAVMVAQSQVVTLKFVGADRTGQDYVRLHHVSVYDHDQLWHQVIYYPDTTLALFQNGTVGIVGANNHSPLQLAQNTPNPFTGTTDVNLTTADAGDVTLEIVDGNGKTVGTHHVRPEIGTHQFRISLNAVGTYVMTARQNGKTSSIKMVCNGGGGGNSITHVGSISSDGTITLYLKSGMSDGSYPFRLNDRMEFIGYAVIDSTERVSETVTCNQGYASDYSLKFDVARPEVATLEPTGVTAHSAIWHGSVIADNNALVTERGFCWKNGNGSPTLADNHVAVGDGVGAFAVGANDYSPLQPATTYRVRAYAQNAIGITYGNVVTFTTNDTLPEVTTTQPTNVASTAFTCGGNVVAMNSATLTARGVCWNTTGNPTMADSHTTDGTTAGSFTSSVTELECGTTYYVRAYATNSAGTSYGEEYEVTTLAPTVPDVATLSATLYNGLNMIVTSEVTSENCAHVISRGICYSTSPNPTISDSHTTHATGMGTLNDTVTGLNTGTTYYVRAYATNSLETAYGEELSVTTPTLPAVTTTSVTNVTSTTATCGGNVTDDGDAIVTARGVCWSTSPNPTIGDTHTTNGTGTGSFTSSITGLTDGTTYYVRAYATNVVGTVYGQEFSFTTLKLPTVETVSVTNITTTTARGSGNVTDNGGANITTRGLCWSTSHNPTVSNSHTTNGTGTGSFNGNLTGLTSNTTYYVRAYATNSVGTAYGNEMSFTTVAQDGDLCPGVPTVTDRSGNSYNTVVIGEQCWMKESLRTKKYADGTSISQGSGSSTTTAYWYYPNNNSSNQSTYGLLYNWKAVMRNSASSSANPSDVQGICPDGWHVPSNAEWTQLENYVGSLSQYVCGSSSYNIAKALSGTTGWTSNSSTCTVGNTPSNNNATGFSALPAGYYSSSYNSFGTVVGFWSATQYSSSDAYYRAIYNNYAYLYPTYYSTKSYGYSVRCLLNKTMPTVTTASVSNNTGTSATCGGNVTDDGHVTVTARGVCWSTSPNPTVSNSHTTDGGGTGSFTSSITGLSLGVTYYVRAYATNSLGTAYGQEVTFTTPCHLPEITTTQPTNVASTTFTSGGNVTAVNCTELTARGVCWNTTGATTVADSHTSDGTAAGSFTSSVTGLEPATQYYVRAYATNAVGTVYGEIYAVTTLNDIPIVVTAEVSDIAARTAQCGGEVVNNHGATVTERGVCWNTTGNPTIADSYTTDGNGLGEFASTLNLLTPNTQYYIRAYATNSVGTAYGEERSFIALCDLPEVTTTQPTNVTTTSFSCGGDVIAINCDNLTARGVCWNTTGNPTVADSHTTDGTAAGSFTSGVTGLEPATQYYIRAYATNSAGTAYGEIYTVTTLNDIPIVVTAEVSNIAARIAQCGGEVVNEHGAAVTERGVCWNTTGNPTLAESYTTDGSGLGEFASTLNLLTPNTQYYVRAYATNSVGTAYGEEKSFTTMCDLPEVTTEQPTNVSATSFTGGGNVIGINCTELTARGVCWNTTGNPTVADSHTTDGTAAGSFTSSVTGLECGTTYYVRAYATNSVGTSYGEEIMVSTSEHDVPAVATLSATVYNGLNVIVNAEVISENCDAVTMRGVCYSTSQNPTISNLHTTQSAGLGTFADTLTGLAAGTTYYVRAYATNSVGTAYGEELSATTPTLPTVTTNSVTNITTTTARCGGNVTSDGGATVTARGVCWSTSHNPTTSGSRTTNGSGNGSFTSSITGLTSSTTYYVRAYATNSAGTAYGNEVSFTTVAQDGDPCPRTPTLTDASGNTYNTVQIGTQCWMKENLRTKKYADGTFISQGSSTSTTTAYWYYPNNSSSNMSTYGLLYNWKAVIRYTSTGSGVQGICPTGWHVPTVAEWTQLTNYVSRQSQYVCDSAFTQTIAKALASTAGWNSSTNTCAVGNTPSNNNATGFSALPAGRYSGSYSGFGNGALFWSATGGSSTGAYYLYLSYYDSGVDSSDNGTYTGCSVRCVRD